MAEGNGGSIEIQDRVSARLNRIISTMERLIDTAQTLDSTMGRVGNTISLQADKIAGANGRLLNSVGNVSADIQTESANMVHSLETINGMDFIPFETNSARVLTALDGVDGIRLDRVESEIESTTDALERMASVADQVNKVNAMDTSPLQKYADQGVLQFDTIGSEMAKLSQYLSRIRDEGSNQPIEIPLSFDSSALDSFEPPQFERVPLEIEWMPVEQPEVFTTTGIDRYQQELGSVNSLLNQASTAQADLNSQAIALKASPAMQADFANMTQRIQGISNEIAKLEANPIDDVVSPSVNNELESLRASLTQITKVQEEVASGLADVNAEAAHKAYNQLNTQVGQVERQIRDNINAQTSFNHSVDEGVNSSNRLFNAVRNIAIAIGASKAVSGAVNLSDTYAQTNARIDMMNDGLQTTAELQRAIFHAAEDSRAEYQATADLVGKIGTLAGDAFGSSAEVVQFAGLINKQFTIAGASAQEAAGATHQLTQALASGVLRGDELNSIMEQAPTIIQSIADYLGVTKGEIREIAMEGGLTADIVKNAMFAATDEINAKFESMFKTWASIWTSFKNNALQAFAPILQRINDIANSQAIQSFVNSAIGSMYLLADVIIWVFDIMGSLGGFISEHWAAIAPIVYAAATALGIYTAALIVYKTHLMITAGIEAVSNLAKSVGGARTMMLAGATFVATAAQHGFNAALLASPITWVVAGLLAIVGALYAGVAMWNHFTGASVSATGIVVGALYVLWDVIMNVFIGIANIALGAVQFVVNLFQAGLYLVQLAWYALQMVVGIVFYAIVYVAQTALNLIGTLTVALINGAISLWHVLRMSVALVWFAILYAAQSAVNGIGVALTHGINAWNQLWHDLKIAVGGHLANMLDSVSSFVNSTMPMVIDMQYAFEMAWYKIQQGGTAMASAIAGAFDSMINSVIGGIETLINSTLNGINKMIDGLNKMPGVNVSTIGEVSLGRSNVASAITSNATAPTKNTWQEVDYGSGLRDSLGSMTAPTDKTWEPVDYTSGMSDWISNQESSEALTWEQMDLSSGIANWLKGLKAPNAPEQWTPDYFDFKNLTEAWERGYGVGEGFEGKLGDLIKNLQNIGGDRSDMGDLADLFNNLPELQEPPASPGGGGGGGNPTGGRLDSVGEIEDEIGLEDDLKELLIAYRHQKWQQNFITMTPNVTNNVEIATDEEYEDFIAKFNDDIADAIYDAMDGVPAN